jgi:acetylglutamate kinase
MTASRIVVKLGGEVIRDPKALASIATEIAALPGNVVVVHGGGPQTSALQQALGQMPQKVGGRRITDAATLECIKMAVAGQANVDLCAALTRAGAKPVGLHGASGAVVRAKQRPARVYSGAGPDPIDLGHVGDVEGFDVALLEVLLSAGHVPVVACVGASEAGEVFNINADIVATRAAVELGATDLFAVMDVPGVMAKLDDPSTRYAKLTIAEAKQLILDSVVVGGMIPKLEESFVALEAGVPRVHLLKGELARAAKEPGSVGTLLVAGAIRHGART